MAAFPAAYSKCISVSAVAADFTPASYSNYGKEVTISAPGGDTEYYNPVGQDDPEGWEEGIHSGSILSTWIQNGNATYGFMDGTSMACPHVSGVVALGLSYAVKQRRHLSGGFLIQKLGRRRSLSCVSLKLYFLGWQEPLIGQSAHPHPQEDFPFFLFFIMLTIIAETTAIKTAQIIIVAMFSVSQASIFLPPVHNNLFCHLNAFGKLCSFRIFLDEQHIDHNCKYRNRCNQADYIQTSGEYRAELINH